ncbi:MAG TPA: sialidase family protein [Candidatus Thermoplasmatota archaeon]|nr:sialidase family protein [Candidatus Thermoplasmatota archaeon]
MRSRALLALTLLLAAPLLAGCLTPAGTEEAPVVLVPQLPALPEFLPVVAMDQPTSGAEPNIAILPDGTIFITAVAGSQEKPNAREGAAWLWRSKDGGTTWETLRQPQRDTPLGTPTAPNTRRPFGSSDADVVASPDGWVYYSDWWLVRAPVFAPGVPTPSGGNYLVERSNDGGDTWESTSVTIPDATDVDRQWLLAGPDGWVGLFYAYFHPVENRVGSVQGTFVMSIKAVYSKDYGATWSDAFTVVPTVENHAYQISHPRLLPDGTIVMAYADITSTDDAGADPGAVKLAVSVDQGLTWEQRHVADVPLGFDNLWAVQATTTPQGGTTVVWAAHDTNDTISIHVADSLDAGRTWTPPTLVQGGGLHFLPWAAADRNGRVALGWYGGNATGKPEEAPEDTLWHAYVAVRDTLNGEWAVSPVSPDPVKVGPLCPKGAACSANRELLDYVSLDYGPDGRLHYAFARSRVIDSAPAPVGHVHYAGEAPLV